MGGSRFGSPYSQSRTSRLVVEQYAESLCRLSSRLAELLMVDDNQPFEVNLKPFAHYLDNLLVVDKLISITPELKRKAKDFLVHEQRLFRRIKYGIRFVPHIEMQESILRGIHDEVRHFDFDSTNSFVRNRFWFPNKRQEVTNFVKSCDICQKTKQANQKELVERILIIRLFHAWCIDFAGPLPRTNAGNQ